VDYEVIIVDDLSPDPRVRPILRSTHQISESKCYLTRKMLEYQLLQNRAIIEASGDYNRSLRLR